MNRKMPKWLKEAVFYQIYPQSYCDTNGDGIGDLQGIIKKLEYIKTMGFNAIWLNPIYESPFGDAGYDVSDYKQIASRYGTMDDYKELLLKAHKLDIKVIMDFVPGHTSIEHPWFKQSCLPERNAYTNRYIWTNVVWEVADSMIKGYSDRDGSFMYNFFYFQPKLNYGYANPDPERPWQLPTNHPDVLALRREMIDIIRFWMDTGIDGLRIDMASSLIMNDSDLTETRKLWGEVRAVFDNEYPEAAMLSEWGHPINAIGSGFHADFLLRGGTTMYTPLFRKEKGRSGSSIEGYSIFGKDGKGDITEFLDQFMEHLDKTRPHGYILLPTGSHDMPRLNYDRDMDELKVIFTFIFTMPSLPIVYYGDEIGMRHIKGMKSKEGGYNRTGARTPMQWDNSKNMGFSEAGADQLYLPMDMEGNTVESQLEMKDSLLNHVKKLVLYRKNKSALGVDGEFIPLYCEKGKYPFVYERKYMDQRLLVILNPCGHDCEVKLSESFRSAELIYHSGVVEVEPCEKTTVKMSRLSFGIYSVE